MYNLLLIPNKEVTSQQLNEIIKIKSKSWPYSFDKQLEWINSNLKKNDIHVLLSFDKQIIAYLNLIEIEFSIDGYLKNGYGLGNVCSSEKGKGWGKIIMTQINLILKEKNKIGLLFCKKSLVAFYSINNWLLIERKKVTLSFNNESIETMIFNWNGIFQHLEFLGIPF
ncbi:MAG TPA: hypothetical protein VIJ75_04530 [Hanamia sp.]